MRSQIDSLTSTRAFAAITVIIFHFGKFLTIFDNYAFIFFKGHIAVSYFYVLSGFVLYISYTGRKIDYGDFIKKRLARIGPAYFLAMVLCVLIFFFLSKQPYSTELLKHVIFNLFFIQAWIPQYALVLNIAAWSISVEMLFYLLFPVLLIWQMKRRNSFVVATLLLFAVTQIIFIGLFKRNYILNESWKFLEYYPLMHINQFMIGMIGGYFFKRFDPAKKRFMPPPVVFLFVLLYLFAAKPDNLYYEVGLIAPVFMIFILSIAIYDPVFLRLKPLVFLGEISYGIYILQFPVHEFAMNLNQAYLKLAEPAFFFFTLGVLCISATLCYYLIERPVRNWVNRKPGQLSAR